MFLSSIFNIPIDMLMNYRSIHMLICLKNACYAELINQLNLYLKKGCDKCRIQFKCFSAPLHFKVFKKIHLGASLLIFQKIFVLRFRHIDLSSFFVFVISIYLSSSFSSYRFIFVLRFRHIDLS